MKKNRGKKVSRRGFLRTAIEAAVPSSILLCGFLAIVPASVFGKNSPASQINIGAIGTGRISRGHDIPGVWKYDNVRIMAVCDLDSKRAEDARRLVNDYYSKKTGKAYDGVAVYADYRELLKNGVLTTSTARTGPWERSTRGRLRCRAWRSSPQKPVGRARQIQNRSAVRRWRENDLSDSFPNGIRFAGTEGWIFVSRGDETVTASDPVAKLKDSRALAASDLKIITSIVRPDEIHLYESKDHHGNWLDCVRSRQQPIAPVEVAHRSCSACLIHHISMKLKRRLFWDPLRERFKNDDQANTMLSRPQRWPYIIH